MGCPTALYFTKISMGVWQDFLLTFLKRPSCKKKKKVLGKLVLVFCKAHNLLGEMFVIFFGHTLKQSWLNKTKYDCFRSSQRTGKKCKKLSTCPKYSRT